MKLSVIIPTLNEALCLPEILRCAQAACSDAQIIVSDGGSTDDTLNIANDFDCNIVQGSPGRARQCNAGAMLADGDVFLFLHADALLPLHTTRAIQHAMEHGYIGGAFRIHFMEQGFRYRALESWVNFRAELLQSYTGDQGLFVSADIAREAGLFADIPILEDVEFPKRLLEHGSLCLLNETISTPPRRWQQHGYWSTALSMARARWQFATGRDFDSIAKSYYQQKTQSEQPPLAKSCICIFAKQPVPGQVKTRLAKDTGADTAAAIYKTLCDSVVRRCMTLPSTEVNIQLQYAPASADAYFRQSYPEISRQLPQGEGNLGDRLTRALHSCFEAGYQKVIFLGSDCIDIDDTLLQQALQSLDRYDVVLGPANDGGYYLLGCSDTHDEMFSGIPWSSDKVLQCTRDRITELGLTHTELPLRSDIDHLDDLLQAERQGLISLKEFHNLQVALQSSQHSQ